MIMPMSWLLLWRQKLFWSLFCVLSQNIQSARHMVVCFFFLIIGNHLLMISSIQGLNWCEMKQKTILIEFTKTWNHPILYKLTQRLEKPFHRFFETYSKPYITSIFIVLLYFYCTLSFYKNTLFTMASLSFKIAIWQAHKRGKCIFFYYIALFLA